MKSILVITLLMFTLVSCNKEKIPFTQKSINSLTSEVNEENKYLTQLRLSFAKVVANAFEDIEFREYINKVSRENTDSFFNEIVFAIHKDDKVIGDKSLKTILEEAADKEIKSLLGANFIDRVLKDDPLVVIKIPDIFYDFDWDVEQYAPLVLSKTPIPLSDDNNFFSYFAFHYSGFQKIFSNHLLPNYFTIVIKYSEDYILYNKNTERSEKNIHIFDIVHQVKRKWETINSKIHNIGVPYFLDKNMIFLKKRDIFNLAANIIEPHLFTYGDFSNCNKPCYRDCTNLDSLYNVLDWISLNSLIIDQDSKGSILFKENYSLLFFISIANGNIYKKIIDMYDLSGFRKTEFVDRNLDIDYEITEETYENIGEVKLLNLKSYEFNYKRFKSKKIVLNHLIEKGWQGGYINHDLIALHYNQEDLISIYSGIDNTIFPIPVYATGVYSLGRTGLSYCSKPNTNYHLGVIDFVVKY